MPDHALSHAHACAQAALSAVDACTPVLNDTFASLAQCESAASLPEASATAVAQSAQSLRRTAHLLQKAQAQASSMADELTARLQDVQQSLRRKWYLPNPPSNTLIDHAEQHRAHFAQGMNAYKLGLILFFGSFAGVVVELIWCLLTNGYIESRAGLVYGPFNMLYGVGAAALSLALYRFRNRGRWLSFLGGFVVGSVLEYFCSFFQQQLFGSVSWDYSHLPFHLNGRICLMYSVFWGFLGVWWIKDIYPRMSRWILRLPNRFGKILTWAMVIFLLFNCTVSGLAVHRWSQRLHGVEASSSLSILLDNHFPNARMEQIYANMTFD